MSYGSNRGGPPKEMAGYLEKQGKHSTIWQKRWFVAHEGRLMYYGSPRDTTAKGSTSLCDTVVTPSTSEKLKKMWAFELSGPSFTRVYVLHASSRMDMEEWIAAIQAHAAYASSSSSSAPSSSLDGSRGGQMDMLYHGESVVEVFAPSLAIGSEFHSRVGVPSRFVQWRMQSSIHGLTNSLSPQFRSSMLAKEHHMPFTSCITMHDRFNWMAVGSSCAGVGMPAVQILRTDNKADRTEFMVVKRTGARTSYRAGGDANGLEGVCTDISWMDDKLLCGSSNGRVCLYNCDPEEGGQGSANAMAVFAVNQTPSATTSSSKWHQDLQVRRVAINPIRRSRFVAVEGERFHVWDMTRVERPLHSEQGSVGPLFAGAWSPFDSEHFIYGGATKSMKMLDMRMLTSQTQKCVVWKVERAHGDSIRDIAFSPMVPHWIATAGDDGSVKVWDLRNQKTPIKCSRQMQAHTNAVSRVAWSRSHSEMLISGGTDGSVRWWNCRVAPHYVVATLDQMEGGGAREGDIDRIQPKKKLFNGAVVGVSYSSSHPLQFYSVSSVGELVATTIDKSALTDLVPERPLCPFSMRSSSSSSTSTSTSSSTSLLPSFASSEERKEDEDNDNDEDRNRDDSETWHQEDELLYDAERLLASERQVDSLLYQRDFHAAYQLIAQLATMYLRSGGVQGAERATHLLKLTSGGLFKDVLDDDREVNGKRSFTKLVNELSRYVPPNSLRLTKTAPAVQQQVQFLKLRLMLSKNLNEKNYEGIFELEKNISEHLSRHPTIFEPSTLLALVASLLPYDHIRAIRMAIKIGMALSTGDFKPFHPIGLLILQPTIYDRIPHLHVDGGRQNDAEGREEDLIDSDEEDGPEYSRLSTTSDSSSKPLPLPLSHSHSRNPSITHTHSRRPSISEVQPSVTVTSPSGTSGTRRYRTPLRASTSSSSASLPKSAGEIHAKMNAQITIDRDLRNPKLVLPQLELLVSMFECLSEGEVDEEADERRMRQEERRREKERERKQKAEEEPEEKKGGSSSKREEEDDDDDDDYDDSLPSSHHLATRFNPYRPNQFVLNEHNELVAIDSNLFTAPLPALNSRTAKQVITSYEVEKDARKILPALAHRIYFHALVQQKGYDKFFILATKLAQALKYYDMSAWLNGLVEDVANKKFTKWFEKTATRDPTQPWLTQRLIAGALTIINTLLLCKQLPSCLKDMLPGYLSTLTQELRLAFQEMIRNPDYKQSKAVRMTGGSGKADVKIQAQSTLEEVAKLREMSRTELVYEEVNQFVQMLQQFRS